MFLRWLRRVLDGCQHQHTLLAILPEGLAVRCADCDCVKLLPIDRPRYRYRFDADLTHPVVGMLREKAIAQQERARREKALW